MYQPTRTQLLIEALEFYIQDLKKNNCTEASIQTYTELLNEIETQDEIYDETISQIWEVDDEEDLIEEITCATGWCIKSIDY